MRIKTGGELPKWLEIPIAVVLVTITSPAWLVLFAAIWTSKGIEWLIGPSWYWRPWFAWHPVKIDQFKDQMVWLEWIERRSWYSHTLYRMPGDPKAFGAADGERSAHPHDADKPGSE